MDNIAVTITHYFLYFFHYIGMDSFLYLFGNDAYWCAVGYDSFTGIKSLRNCHNVIWIGYFLPISLIVIAVWRRNSKK